VARGRRAVGHAGDRLRPLLLVPDLLRGAAGGVRLVARGHRGGVLDLVRRAGGALTRRRDARGPLRATPGHARRRLPARRRLCPVGPDRLAVGALPGDGSAGRGRRVRGELDPERGADRTVVHRAARQHDGARVLGHGRGPAGDRPARPVVDRWIWLARCLYWPRAWLADSPMSV